MKLLYLTLTFVLFACQKTNKTNVLSFKTGTFKTYLGGRKDSSTFYRSKNLQVETYKSKTDSFYVYWKSSFEYELHKVNPKKKLDSIPFIVKITGIKQNQYNFKGFYKGSNFKQTGTTYKVSSDTID